MPRSKSILAVLCLAAAALAAGCGGDEEPEPSIPLESAETLISTLQEVQANVDNGSCLVAADKVQELQEELAQLPSEVNQDVLDALQRGTLSLGDLVDEQCDEPEPTTTEETTTEEQTTTEETTTEEQTTTTQPPTTTTAPPPTTTAPPSTGGGGVGPPGSDGL